MKNFNAGHLRAIVALIFVIAINLGFFLTTKISTELFASFASAAITYYFSGKNTSSSDSSDPGSNALSLTTTSKVVQTDGE